MTGIVDEFDKSWFASDNWHRDIYIDETIRCASCGLSRQELEQIGATEYDEYDCCFAAWATVQGSTVNI
jgi:hypothetical protein